MRAERRFYPLALTLDDPGLRVAVDEIEDRHGARWWALEVVGIMDELAHSYALMLEAGLRVEAVAGHRFGEPQPPGLACNCRVAQWGLASEMSLDPEPFGLLN